MIINKRAGLLIGKFLSVVAVLLQLNGVLWRWIYTIRGERYVGSFPSQLFWAGAVIFFVGLIIIRAFQADEVK